MTIRCILADSAFPVSMSGKWAEWNSGASHGGVKTVEGEGDTWTLLGGAVQHIFSAAENL